MTRDQVIQMALDAGYSAYVITQASDKSINDLRNLIQLSAAKERAACLELVEKRGLLEATSEQQEGYLCAQRSIAAGIRARGEA
jgi:hypothetical protein